MRCRPVAFKLTFIIIGKGGVGAKRGGEASPWSTTHPVLETYRCNNAPDKFSADGGGSGLIEQPVGRQGSCNPE